MEWCYGNVYIDIRLLHFYDLIACSLIVLNEVHTFMNPKGLCVELCLLLVKFECGLN